MAETNVPDDLKPWLRQCQDRIAEMISADNPMDAQQKYKELLEMAQQFISLSKAFVGFADKAYKGAQAMHPIEGENRGKTGNQ
jgi:uncharacterized membrane protein YfbV (UPF0208 family)